MKLPSDPAILGYLAGIIDGEGSITIRLEATPRAYVFISVTNTCQILKEWLRPFGGAIIERKQETGRLGKKPLYYWTVRARLDCLALLVAVEPYMVIKRDKALRAIAVLRDWETVVIPPEVLSLGVPQ